MGFVDALHGKLYLDANVFIYALEGRTEHGPAVLDLLGSIDEGRLIGVTSELTLAELLVKPFQLGSSELQAVYLEMIRDRGGMRVVPISRTVLVESARLRAVESMRLPDGIHFATAKLAGCDMFISNDLRLRSRFGIRVVRVPER